MVQLFYYESRGQPVKRLMRREGTNKKVLLFPYEGWAQPASATYLSLKTNWWSRNCCNVVQISGTKRMSTRGRISTSPKTNTMVVMGKFKEAAVEVRCFRLTLTTDVSNADFQLGYSMVGCLERGFRWDSLQMTHFAMIKRKGY